jgi:hypothetical protein
MLDIKCPNCECQLQLPEDAVWRDCQCPSCGTVFVPADRRARQSRQATPVTESTDTIDDVDIRFDFDEAEQQASVLAERRRYQRQLEAENADNLASEFRWITRKAAAKIGFGIGCVSGVVSAFLVPRPNICDVSWAIFGVGLLGALHGVLIVSLVQLLEPHEKPVVQWSLVGLLAIWVAVFLLVTPSEPLSRVDVNSLAFAGVSGLPVILFGWVVVAGLIMVGRLFRR